ncbi:hypothetical protein B0H13DRAFT_1930165 [Mycena leptocephala]|nr:hypothetical protein B0H13DRAFT_1930165 [Mycena leptocephala]
MEKVEFTNKICAELSTTQQDGSKIKHFFRQSEMSTLLKDCHSGLEEAREVFKIEIGTTTFNTIDEMKEKTVNMHNELLELIATLSNGTLSDRSSVYSEANGLQNRPKIFHGRESELRELVGILSKESPRIAILGGGGSGCLEAACMALSMQPGQRSIHTQILQRTDHDPLANAWELVNIAQIDVMIGGAKETVQQNLTEAKAIFSTMKHVFGVTCCEMILADLQLREGNISAAQDILQDCLNLCWGKYSEAVSFCLEIFGDRNRWHVMECASPWPVVYRMHGQQLKERLAVHKALLFLGDIFIAQGDDDTAKNLFTVAMGGGGGGRAQCLLRLGDLASKKGDFSHATELWTAALPLFEKSSQAKSAAQVNARLVEIDHNQKALVHLMTLHPPEDRFTELSFEVGKVGIEEG